MSLNLIPLIFLLSACSTESVRIGGVVFESICIEEARGESALAIADIDHDGHLDLVVANQTDNNIIVFIGDGQGGFTRLDSTPAGENPTDVVARDINGDDRIDLVIANHETSYLTLLIGDGRGRFRPSSNSPLLIVVEPHPHAVGAADLNSDGNVDLIVDDRSGTGLLVLPGTGTGEFETEGVLIDVGGDPYRGFAIGDLNGDGRLDLVTPNSTEVAIMIQTDTDQMSFRSTSPLAGESPFAVAIADVNGDSFPDIISASESSRSAVRVFLGNGQGEFSETVESPFHIASGAKRIVTGDVNGDGFDDVIISSWTSDVLILIGGAESLEAVRLPGFENPWGLAIGDLNEDGRDDFVIADGTDPEIRIYTSEAKLRD